MQGGKEAPKHPAPLFDDITRVRSAGLAFHIQCKQGVPVQATATSDQLQLLLTVCILVLMMAGLLQRLLLSVAA